MYYCFSLVKAKLIPLAEREGEVHLRVWHVEVHHLPVELAGVDWRERAGVVGGSVHRWLGLSRGGWGRGRQLLGRYRQELGQHRRCRRNGNRWWRVCRSGGIDRR